MVVCPFLALTSIPMAESLFICGGQELRGEWEGALVALSWIVAIAGSFVGLECADRMRNATTTAQRRRYFLAGAGLMGLAIWTMHFVGMLAHRLSIPVAYGPALGGASILAAVFGAGLAFRIVDRPTVTRAHALLGGIAMGLAIALMHYIGMASMRMPAMIRYQPVLFVASILLAIVVSTGALFLARRPLRSGATAYLFKGSSAVVLGSAIAGMHYVGMAAACYIPTAQSIGGSGAIIGPWSLKEALVLSGLLIGGALLALATKSSAERHLALESLEVQRQQAVEASRAKDVFLASLSHELRTPLNPALLLATDGAGNPAYPTEVRETFASIANQIAVEARLIDDLLDLTRITRGIVKVERRTVDLHTIVKASAATVRSNFTEKDLALVLSLKAERHWGDVDAIRMQQVVCNLLLNAAKFTDRGGRVTVSTQNLGSDIGITVADTGVGMSAPDLRRCFEAFAQGGHKRGGLGLGLAIARGIVETHGGTISAASDGPGHGSSFCVTIATTDEAPQPDVLPLVSGPDEKVNSLRNVLLVEDHAASRLALERLLSLRGFQVTCAASVGEAVRAASASRFNLLIADIGLPDGDGYHLLQKLDGNLPPVSIAITGYGMEEDIRRMHEAGFSAHLIKPVTIDKLDAVLAEAQRV